MNHNSSHSARGSVSNKVSLRQPKQSNKSIRGSNSSIKKRGSKNVAIKRSATEQNSSDENDKFVIVTIVKQEILDKALELIYEKYLEKQTVYFVSHCSHLAWKSLIGLNYQRKDKGGLREHENKEHLDVEPKSSPKDSWAGNSIPIVKKHQKPLHVKMEKKSLRSDVSELLTVEDFNKAAEELTSQASKLTILSSDRAASANKKIFPKQIRKSDDPLLSIVHVKGMDLRKDSYELPAPIPLQDKYFPSSRVDVRYNISPGVRGQINKKEPKVKTIRLKKDSELPEVTENDLRQ